MSTPTVDYWSFPPAGESRTHERSYRDSDNGLHPLRRWGLLGAVAALVGLTLVAIQVRSPDTSNQQLAIEAVRSSGGTVTMAAARSSRFATNRPTAVSGPIESIEVFNPRVFEADFWDTGILAHPNALLRLRAPLDDDDLMRLAPFDNLHTLDLRGERFTNDALIHLQELPRLETLTISGESINDDGLRCLRRLPRLRSLAACGPGITDVGLAEICQLPTLRDLTLTNTRITDNGLRHVARLDRLFRLSVANNAVTDVGLAHLHRLTELTWLNIERTDITDEGIRTLQCELPLCRLYCGR